MKPVAENQKLQPRPEPGVRVAKVSAVAPDRVTLPKPVRAGRPLGECLSTRRSTRDYANKPISSNDLSELLWAALGFTAPGGLKAAPSAGAIFPLRGFVFVGNVQGVAPGFYRYDEDQHELILLQKGDKRNSLEKAACDQGCVAGCACALFLSAWMKRANREFGEAAPRLAAMEAGHIGQNWLLEATSLGLGAIGLGKFDATAMKMLLPLPADEELLYMLLAGHIQA